MPPQFITNSQKSALPGFSLVELLIALALMGALALMISNLVLKNSTLSHSMRTRYEEAVQVHAFILDLQQDLAKGAYISNNSHSKRLEYTTYDSDGNPVKKIFGICYSTDNASSSDTTCPVSSGGNTVPYLKRSMDGGSTWDSPFRVSPYNVYRLSTSAAFVFAQDENNCTAFTDTNANGVWNNGVDVGGAATSCGSYAASIPILNYPSQSTKIILSNFQFTSSTGLPPVVRSLPPSIFMSAPQGLVVSPAAAVQGIKDSPLVKSFTTNTAAMRFGTNFDIRSVTWDPSRQRLLIVGNHTGGTCKIFQADRTGVLIGPGLSLRDANIQLQSVALLEDGQSVVALDASTKLLYWFNIRGKTPLIPYRIFNLGNPSGGSPSVGAAVNLVNSPNAILYDPQYPDEIFVSGIDPVGGQAKIFEISTSTGALAATLLSGGALTLPAAAFDATHPVGGLAQEPLTGDFLISRNYVNGSSPDKTIDIYRMTSAGAYTSFSVNIDDLGSTATGTTGSWGLGYSAEMNHLFLANSANDQMYEILPSVLISRQ